MSEQSIGDISHNKVHQLLEALQADGLPAGLLHRLRLDKEYRDAFVMQARTMDREMVGKKLAVEWHEDFRDSVSIVTALKERSPYANSVRHSYRLKDEILLTLLSEVKSWRAPSDFPLELYVMPLYKRMTRKEVHDELVRRQLLFAGAVDALCLATRFSTKRGGPESILVPGATLTGSDGNRSMLSFSRNCNGDPILSLTRNGDDLFQYYTLLLVKRRPAAFM